MGKGSPLLQAIGMVGFCAIMGPKKAALVAGGVAGIGTGIVMAVVYNKQDFVPTATVNVRKPSRVGIISPTLAVALPVVAGIGVGLGTYLICSGVKTVGRWATGRKKK